MSYTPSSWKYTLNEKNEKVYDDHILNIVQENLLTISKFIDDFRQDARYDITIVQDNLNAKTVHNPTVSIIGFFASKLNQITRAYSKQGRSDLVIIGHPKSMTHYSFEQLEAFIVNNHQKHTFKTFADVQHELKP
jgi:hypothetical protein